MTSIINKRKYMQLAISEMRKSRSEHNHKADPLVGAVLIGQDGKLLGKTHRGSLRMGDHAEYTLIERLLTDSDLDGAKLFVTLEPCTARQFPKKPCAERIISARISSVCIGMLDPNPDIEGHGISLLQRNNVEVDFFDLDLVQMIREENKEFIAQYQKSSEQSENATGVFEGPSSKEKEIVPAASTKELDNDLIGEYLLARGQELTIPSKELWEFLSRNALVHLDNRSGKYIPTVAGLLLFGKNPEDFLVQSKIKAEVNQGGKTKVFDLKGPLVSLVAAVQSFLEENMRTYTEIREFKRVEVPEYPWEAMREAIINAIVHRDYVEGARVFVRLSDDSLIIKSPGLPLQPLSLAKIQAYNAPPYSRNPRIADTFYHFALMEERGWGLGRMRDVLTQHGLPPPRFSYDGNYFVVTFSGNRQHGGTLQVGADLLASLDDRLRKIVVIVEEKGRITSLECAKKLRVDRSTAIRSLNKLQKHGVLEKKGRGATVYYVLGSGR